MSLQAQSTLIPMATGRILPPTIEAMLRRITIDKFTGNVQLNIKDGKVIGYRKEEVGHIPSSELR